MKHPQTVVMRLYVLQLLFVLLLAGLGCCRPATRQPDWDYVHTFSHDSMRRALESGHFEPPEEMVANGVIGINYFTLGMYDSARIYSHYIKQASESVTSAYINLLATDFFFKF